MLGPGIVRPREDLTTLRPSRARTPGTLAASHGGGGAAPGLQRPQYGSGYGFKPYLCAWSWWRAWPRATRPRPQGRHCTNEEQQGDSWGGAQLQQLGALLFCVRKTRAAARVPMPPTTTHSGKIGLPNRSACLREHRPRPCHAWHDPGAPVGRGVGGCPHSVPILSPASVPIWGRNQLGR